MREAAKNDEPVDRLRAHVMAMTFEQLPAGYIAADWRLHPMGFAAHLGRCGWMSLDEMSQVVIRKIRGTPRIPIDWGQARSRIGTHFFQLNRTFRNFGFADRRRRAHFFGQCIQESDYQSWPRKAEQLDEGGRCS